MSIRKKLTDVYRIIGADGHHLLFDLKTNEFKFKVNGFEVWQGTDLSVPNTFSLVSHGDPNNGIHYLQGIAKTDKLEVLGTATIDNLAINNLSLRGKSSEFNKLSRFFMSKQDALDSVASGDYVPTPGTVNAVLILGQGIMIYSFDLLDFVHISQFIHAGDQANKYIDLDGVNDYIEFNNAGDALDFTKDFTIGVTLLGLTGPASAGKMTIFSRGGVHITLNAQAGSTNWGLYVTSNNDLYNTANRAQANTWYAPSEFSRLLFVYTASDRKLKYFIGDPSTGSFAQRANLSIPQSMVDGQDINGGLCIGRGWSGTGGATFSGINWHGGVNNLVISDIPFTGPHLTEYFQTGEEFTEMELYSDVLAYCKLGEDVYPNVSDEKGLLTGGELINGAADDFKDIPTE